MGIAPTGDIFRGFTFDGEDSKDFGVYITGEGAYNAPERAVEMISIPGRNGAYALDHGRWENIEVTYTASIATKDPQEFSKAVSDLRNMLCSKTTYCKLTDDYNPDEYRMALYRSGLEVEPAQAMTGEFDIVFECKPQRFLVSGDNPVSVSGFSVLANSTRFTAKPLLEVYGTGTVSIGAPSDYGAQTIGRVPLALDTNFPLELRPGETKHAFRIADRNLFNDGDNITIVNSTATFYFEAQESEGTNLEVSIDPGEYGRELGREWDGTKGSITVQDFSNRNSFNVSSSFRFRGTYAGAPLDKSFSVGASSTESGGWYDVTATVRAPIAEVKCTKVVLISTEASVNSSKKALFTNIVIGGGTVGDMPIRTNERFYEGGYQVFDILDDSTYNTGDTLRLQNVTLSCYFTRAAGSTGDMTGIVERTTNASASYTGMAEGDRFGVLTTKLSTMTFVAGTAATKQATVTVRLTGTNNGAAVDVSSDVTISVTYNGSDRISIFATGTFTPFTFSIGKATLTGIPLIAESSKSAVGDPTYIDCENGEAWIEINGEPVNVNSGVLLPVKLPELQPGATLVQTDNTITGLDIVPRWWKL